MLVFRIIATVFIGMSCITAFIKNAAFFKDSKYDLINVILWTLYGWLWRAFCIVALWII